MRCATALQRTSSQAARTCAACRSCSAMRAPPRRRSIPRLTRRICSMSTARRIRGREAIAWGRWERQLAARIIGRIEWEAVEALAALSRRLPGSIHQGHCRWKSIPTFTTNIGRPFEAVILPDDPHKKGREDANMLSDQKKLRIAWGFGPMNNFSDHWRARAAIGGRNDNLETGDG